MKLCAADKGFRMDCPETSLLTAAAKIVPYFIPADKLLSVSMLGDGNINNTFLLKFTNRTSVVLQQVNKEVFPDPALVADNVRMVTEHIRRKQTKAISETRAIELIQTRNGENSYRDALGNIWRMIDYVENTVVHSLAVSAELAFEGGKVLGGFHHYLDDLDPHLLKVPLPGFHDLPGYCRHYYNIRQGYGGVVSTDLSFCLREAEKRLDQANVLEEACRSGKIVRRVIHGDPKLANILFAADSGRGVAMIDLDTVSQGLLQYDLGDCLRSFCNTLGEKPENPEDVFFNLALCELVLSGYVQSGAKITENERALVFQGVRLLTYELAVRFLTDYLEGNRYFKTAYEQENLQRALSQFHLLESIEQQKALIEEIALDV